MGERQQQQQRRRQQPPQKSQQVSATRVCIKNLPPQVDEIDLKEFLTTNSKNPLTVTDVKVLRNAKGKSRKVGFVGFRDAAMASHVVEYFHKSYLRSCRISAEPAAVKQDPQAGARLGTQADGSAEKADNEAPDDSAKEPSLTEAELAVKRRKEEFLQVMGGKDKAKFWADDAGNAAEEASSGASANKPSLNDKSDSNSDSESDSEDSSDSGSDDESDSEGPEGNEPKKMSDLDFLRSKQTAKTQLSTGNTMMQDEIEAGNNAKSNKLGPREDAEAKRMAGSEDPSKDAPKDVNMDDGAGDDDDDDDDHDSVSDRDNAQSQNRLFVRNLPFGTTEDELRDHFSPFGNVIECHIPVDDAKKNKGFAFITFQNAAEAHDARFQLDTKDFQGRIINVMLARPSLSPAANDAIHMEGMSWKQKQEYLRKVKETGATDGDGAQGWSASFVRGDAVVDNIVERLGIKKGDLLGVKDGLDSGDAAVRLALAETQIVEENRNFFKDHGIDMDVLISADNAAAGGADADAGDTSADAEDGGAGNGNGNRTSGGIKRSKTSLLVKNLPHDTSVEELSKLFHFGNESVNIILPPSKTIAVVEYSHASAAKQAFRKLAYKRFKHVPIYLEWAPLASKTAASTAADTTAKTAANSSSLDSSGGAEEADAEAATSEGMPASLYVKNLNFATTEAGLRSVFVGKEDVGKVLSVRIPKKVSPSGQSVSMGYGFVELDSHKSARTALKSIQGQLLDGFALDLRFSKQAKSSSSTNSRKTKAAPKNATKLMVRNVPFQATRKELLKLFGSFGQLRKVRLPKKFDGSHRGFAFVEYVTTKEAESGMAALSKTHLYGRHLVIEWASNDDDNTNVAKLRKKAGKDMTRPDAGKVRQNKKIRFN